MQYEHTVVLAAMADLPARLEAEAAAGWSMAAVLPVPPVAPTTGEAFVVLSRPRGVVEPFADRPAPVDGRVAVAALLVRALTAVCAAAEGSSKLDAVVAEALGWRLMPGQDAYPPVWVWRSPTGEEGAAVPPYTTAHRDADYALPNGCYFERVQRSDPGEEVLYRVTVGSFGSGVQAVGLGRTLPLASTAGALWAHLGHLAKQ